MKIGHSSVRGTDINAMKACIIDMVNTVCPGSRKDTTLTSSTPKVALGFQNEWTGKMLCPASSNWDDPRCVPSCW